MEEKNDAQVEDKQEEKSEQNEPEVETIEPNESKDQSDESTEQELINKLEQDIVRLQQEKDQIYNKMLRLQAERSEEHTSELQSRFDLVCRLLLEKKE